MYGVNPYLVNPYSQASFTNNPYLRATNGSVQFVNGVESAKTYPLIPNSQAILMDKNTSRFYWVESDAAGAKSMKVFAFQEVKEESGERYLTKEEFERWKKNYEPTLSHTKQPGDVIEVETIHGSDEPSSSKSTASGLNRFRTY